MRRNIWVSDESVKECTRCRTPFSISVFKHHCRRCGQIFCDDCSKNRLLVPSEELVPRPATWFQQKMPDLLSDEDNFRIPQRVCDPCSHVLRMNQGELRQNFSMCNQQNNVQINSNIPSLPGIDFRLEHEISKAVVMLHNFTHTQGEEMIPKELLVICKGVVFFTIVKAGFMFSGRYGTGLIVTKARDGTWSAPSALMISGLGWGFQVGAEVTDVMLILTSDSAVETFKSRAQVSVGAELGVSVGPIGRSIGSDVTAGNKGTAHAFSYAHSKGLFLGASLEASGIASRPDVNQMYYGEKVSTSALLSGEYPRPRGADVLYRALQSTMSSVPALSTSTGPSNYTSYSSSSYPNGESTSNTVPGRFVESSTSNVIMPVSGNNSNNNNNNNSMSNRNGSNQTNSSRNADNFYALPDDATYAL